MATRNKTINLNTWEEIPVALIFQRAKEHAAKDAERGWNAAGLSAALSMGIHYSLPHETPADIVRISELHHAMCKTQEIRHAMQSFTGREWKSSFRGFDKGCTAFHVYGYELLEIYFQFMEFWAIDVGLTYRYQAGTLAGELVYNSPTGPQNWE